MAGTIRARLNHYQMLGVSPTAGSDEIARAFAREGSVLRPHAFGVLAELCLAYETLRDPIKRRAYDASIGLERRPTLQTLPAGARQALLARGPAAGYPPDRPAPAPASAPPPSAQPTFQQQPEPPTTPALPLGPGEDLTIRPEPYVGRGDTHRLELEAELGVEARPVDWRRTATVLGAVVIAACFMGGLAGWWSASGVSEASPPENTMAISLPPPKPVETSSAPETAAAPLPVVPKAPIGRPKPVAAAAKSAASAPVASETDAEEPQPEQVQADRGPVEQVAVDAPAASTVPASMPLPDRVIARTIHRIGYSCGSVASTAPIEGEGPGVFMVTCSSGQTYQARPVKGRYHFRRMGKR